MSRKKRYRAEKGQSTLEYIVIVAVIIGAVIIFATSTLKPKVGESLNHVANQMEVVVNRITY
ncbi:MAG: hypothetical protein Q8O13_11195 [Candidatus Omnitrophota bacterium]|nr:hypothetical protein [Candidatus Omnitrophota bacterium]